MGTIFDRIRKKQAAENPAEEGSQIPERKARPRTVMDRAADRYYSGDVEDVEESSWLSQAGSYASDIGKDVLKGTMEGLSLFQSAIGGQPYDREEYRERLDEIFPTEESFVGGALRKALNIAPLSVTGTSGAAAPSMLSRSAMAGGLSEASERANLPWWMQAAAETVPFLAPNMSKNIPARQALGKASLKQQEIDKILEWGRSKGLSDKDLTPLLQQGRASKVLARVADKGRGTQEALKETKTALGSFFEGLSKRQSAQMELPPEVWTKSINGIRDKLKDIPAEIKRFISEDFALLEKSPQNPASLISFYRKINAASPKNRGWLSTLKNPIRDALAKADPELAKDFKMSNDLYGKYSEIASRLKPTKFDEYRSMTKPIQMALAVGLGEYSLIVEIAGEKAARKLAAAMLTNPRYQRLSSRLVTALNDGKLVLADKIKSLLQEEVAEISPEIASIMMKDSFQD